MPYQSLAMSSRTPKSTAASKRRLVCELDTHVGLMIQSAARILGNVADAEDVAQDVAEKLLRSPPNEGAVGSWAALLKTAATRRAIDLLRKRKRKPSSMEPAQPPQPADDLDDRARAQALREALADLGERDAQLFSLCYFADLSHAQIGEQLDLSTNAVGVALHRLRGRLKDDLSRRLTPSTQE